MKAETTEQAHIGGNLTIRKFRDGKLISTSPRMRNKVVSSEGYGRNLILRWLSGDTALPIVIDSAAVGDDNSAASDGNIELGSTLVDGIPITNMAASNDVLTVDVFVSDANLPDQTYNEFGLFMGVRRQGFRDS